MQLHDLREMQDRELRWVKLEEKVAGGWWSSAEGLHEHCEQEKVVRKNDPQLRSLYPHLI